MLAEMTISWGHVIGGLIVVIVVNVGTWLIAARINGVVQREQMRELTDAIGRLTGSVDKLSERADHHEERIAAVDRGRIKCQAEAGRTYVPRGELAQILAANAEANRSVEAKMDTVHGRITEVSERLAELTGEIRGKQT